MGGMLPAWLQRDMPILPTFFVPEEQQQERDHHPLLKQPHWLPCIRNMDILPTHHSLTQLLTTTTTMPHHRQPPRQLPWPTTNTISITIIVVGFTAGPLQMDPSMDLSPVLLQSVTEVPRRGRRTKSNGTLWTTWLTPVDNPPTPMLPMQRLMPHTSTHSTPTLLLTILTRRFYSDQQAQKNSSRNHNKNWHPHPRSHCPWSRFLQGSTNHCGKPTRQSMLFDTTFTFQFVVLGARPTFSVLPMPST